MTTKHAVLHLLAEADTHVSGQAIASQLNLSRNAVWKAIKSLQQDGYVIEAQTNLGYRLTGTPHTLNHAAIQQHLNISTDRYDCYVYETIGSTNTEAKRMAPQLTKDFAFFIAEEQTAGRGRYGRQFYSPKKNGIYLSVLVKQQVDIQQIGLLTTTAAVAVAEAVETLYDIHLDIKWINDLYKNGKKICGILTEGILNMESGALDHFVIGIGLNISPDPQLPEDLRPVVGSLFDQAYTGDSNVLVATVINTLCQMITPTLTTAHLDMYRSRCFILGKQVTVHQADTARTAHVLAVDDDAKLLVRFVDDGSEVALSHGEVSIRLNEGGTT